MTSHTVDKYSTTELYHQPDTERSKEAPVIFEDCA